MRTRVTFLVMTISVAIVVVACGRASEEQINAALGVTPTVTLSAAEIENSTAAAVAVAATRQSAIAALGSPGSGSPVSLALAGNVTAGKTTFQLQCLRCHNPAGTGSAPAFKGPENPTSAMTDEQLRDLVRTGVGHPKPPGPITSVTITDAQLINIIAFIRDQSK